MYGCSNGESSAAHMPIKAAVQHHNDSGMLPQQAGDLARLIPVLLHASHLLHLHNWQLMTGRHPCVAAHSVSLKVPEYHDTPGGHYNLLHARLFVMQGVLAPFSNSIIQTIRDAGAALDEGEGAGSLGEYVMRVVSQLHKSKWVTACVPLASTVAC
jgi:hypothetical protein